MDPSIELFIAREHDRTSLRRGVGSGDLVRVRRGAYVGTAERHEYLDSLRRAGRRRPDLTAIQATDRQLKAQHVFGHESAAAVHGLSLWRPPSQVHVFVRSTSSSRSARDIARHTAPLPDEHVTAVDGLPVTTLARTVADCALTLPALDALVVADGAMNCAGFDVGEALAWVRSRGRRNGKARADLVLRSARAGTDSVRETWLRYLAIRLGLPSPELQVPVVTRLGRFRTDLGWPEHGVYAEYDGLVKYTPDGVRPGHDGYTELIREKRRSDAIREAGIDLLRVTVHDTPSAIGRRLLARFPPEIRRTARPNPLLPPLS